MMSNKPQFVGEKRRKIRLNELCTKGKSSLRQKDISNGGPYAVYGASGIVGSMNSFQNAMPYVAVVKDGAGVGRTSACAANTSVLGTMQALIPTDGTNRDYLLHLIKSLRLGDDFSGSTIPHIYFKDYGKTLVPFHNPVEQQRIVDILSTVERQIEGSKQQLDQLDSLVKSRFVEMFGNLTDDMMKPLKEVCSVITDGTHQPPKFENDGVPFLFVSNIASNSITYETNKFISMEDYQLLTKRTPIEIGDILVSAVGSFGHPAIVKDGKPFCFQRHIAYLKPIRKLIDSFYLHAALLSDDAQHYMDQCAKGVAQRTVTLKSFKEMRIPVPTVELQQEFAAFVAQVDKSRFAYIWSRTKSVEQALSGPSLTLVIQHIEPQTRSKYRADVLASPSWPSVDAMLVLKTPHVCVLILVGLVEAIRARCLPGVM